MYQISLEGSALVKRYIILKYSRSTLRRIHNKGVEEREGTRKYIKHYY